MNKLRIDAKIHCNDTVASQIVMIGLIDVIAHGVSLVGKTRANCGKSYEEAPRMNAGDTFVTKIGYIIKTRFHTFDNILPKLF